MGFIWALIVGGVIGAIAGAITKKGSSMGIMPYFSFSMYEEVSYEK